MNRPVLKIKNTLLYSGLSKDVYYKVRRKVSESNRETFGKFSLATALVFIIVIFINTFIKKVANISYIIPAVCFIGMYILNRTLAKKYPVISDVMSVIYAVSLLAVGVLIGVSQSSERTTLLLPFFVFASTVFSFRLIYLIIMMVGTESVYLLLALKYQVGSILVVNLTNTLIFCVIGLYVGSILMIQKYQKLETDYNNQYLSEMDPLTDILNRRSFENYIEYLKINSKKHEIGVAIFDIDYFKKYNDFYGHSKGDEILISIVNPIKEYLKQYDDCKLFRYGGEEFVVVIDSVEERVFKDIIIDINSLIYQLNIKRDDIKEFNRVTVSVGGSIEVIPNVNGDYVTNADNQLYLGKGAGRNSVFYKNNSLLNNVESVNVEDNVSGNYIMYQVLTYLCQDFNDIYSVNCKTKRVMVYRSGGKVLGIGRVLKNDYDYDSSFKAYIENNIHPLDKEKVYRKIDFDTVYAAVKQYGVVSIYYRVLRDGVTAFYKIKFIPMGTKDNFESMICAFLPEELDVNKEQVTSMLELDELTSVYTKQAFYHYANKYIEENLDSKFYIIVSDIKNYRFINRVYGDAKSDELLKYLANKYAALDNCKVIGRYDNDQFVMLIKRDDEDTKHSLVDSAKLITNDSPIPYLSIKYGVYKINNIDEPIKAICDKAISALKGTKQFDDLPLTVFDDEFILKQERIQMIETGFAKALDNHEFIVYCQPKYKTKTKEVYGGEALVRWESESGELIKPSEFIPIFERIGAINRLDEYVFDYVCKKQRELIDSGFTPRPISVNMSRNTLYSPSMLKKYQEITDKYQIDKKLVPIEITESWAIENYSIEEIAANITAAGFVLHLDDFGTGYSSLASLNTLPIEVVKLDKSLIDNIGTENGEELLKHIIDLAHFLKMEVVAEGVESESQIEFLTKVNCEAIQGYYFSKPIEYVKYMELIKNQ